MRSRDSRAWALPPDLEENIREAYSMMIEPDPAEPHPRLRTKDITVEVG